MRFDGPSMLPGRGRSLQGLTRRTLMSIAAGGVLVPGTAVILARVDSSELRYTS